MSCICAVCGEPAEFNSYGEALCVGISEDEPVYCLPCFALDDEIDRRKKVVDPTCLQDSDSRCLIVDGLADLVTLPAVPARSEVEA